jgi:hypothetical protein
MKDIINVLLILTPSIIPLAALLTALSYWNKKYLIFTLFYMISVGFNVVEKYIFSNILCIRNVCKRPDQCGYKLNNMCTGCGAIPSITYKESWGMPSGHAQSMAFATTYLILYLYYTKNKNISVFSSLLILLSLLVMFQRINSKCHSVLQVIIGTVFGVVLGYISYRLSNMISKEDFPITN